MKQIIFLTGNINKLQEIKQMIPKNINLTIINRKIDLDEIQSASVEDVISKKIKDAYKKIKKPLFCEDTGLYIKNLNNFPGALIKFYFEALGSKKITQISGRSKVYAETVSPLIRETRADAPSPPVPVLSKTNLSFT